MDQPEELAERMSSILSTRQADLNRFGDYYRGRQDLQFSSDKFLSAFGDRFRTYATNLSALVIDACEERLQINGFRVGETTEADLDAWRLFKVNGLEVGSQVAHRSAMVNGESYLMVWPDDTTGVPRITVESALNMCVLRDPVAPQGPPVAAWKEWVDLDGVTQGTLMTSEEIYRFEGLGSPHPSPLVRMGAQNPTVDRWKPRKSAGSMWVEENRLGAVPVVVLATNPDIFGVGHSDLKNVIPIQDAINKITMDSLVASEYSACRKRWATGVEIPVTEDGKPLSPIADYDARLWVLEDDNVRMGEFDEASLDNYIHLIDMLVKQVAVVSSTPAHYLNPISGQLASGNAIKAVESPLIAKTSDRLASYSQGWGRVMQLAFLSVGDARGDEMVEAIWSDPEFRSEQEFVQSQVILKSIGVSDVFLQARIGMTPSEIERNKVEYDRQVNSALMFADKLMADAEVSALERSESVEG